MVPHPFSLEVYDSNQVSIFLHNAFRRIAVISTQVNLFLQHVAQICTTWMTSCVQFEKTEGYSLGTNTIKKYSVFEKVKKRKAWQLYYQI